ncbi:hypothetical protein Tco_0327080 [Tanacetum coccineum]
MDAMRLAKTMFKDEHKGRSFAQESSSEIFHACPKWDAPDPVLIPTVNVEGTSGGNAKIFGEEKTTSPGSTLKRESDQEKDRTMIKFKELWFLTSKTDGCRKKELIREKYRRRRKLGWFKLSGKKLMWRTGDNNLHVNAPCALIGSHRKDATKPNGRSLLAFLLEMLIDL